MNILYIVNIIFVPQLLYYTYLAVFESKKYLKNKKKYIKSTFYFISTFNIAYMIAFKKSQNILVEKNLISETQTVTLDYELIYYMPVMLFCIHEMFLRPFAIGKTEKGNLT